MAKTTPGHCLQPTSQEAHHTLHKPKKRLSKRRRASSPITPIEQRTCINHTLMPTPQESVDNSPNLFDYRVDNPYNDLIDNFDPYLEYSEGYQNITAFKDAFYK